MKFLITEEEKSRILGMHKSAIAREFLGEQGTPAVAPVATGTPTQPPTQPNPTLDRLNQLMGTSLPKNTRNEDVINAYKTYLGTDINGMVGKTIVVFKNANTTNPEVLGSTIASEYTIGSLYFNGSNTIWVWNTPIKTNFDESKQDDMFTIRNDYNNGAVTNGVSLLVPQGLWNKEPENLAYVKQRLYPNSGTFGMLAKDQTPYSSWIVRREGSALTGFFTITPFISGQGPQLSSTITPIAATPTKP